MRHPFQQRVLQIIASEDGKLTWYQLDRQLSLQGVEREEPLMKVLHALEVEGLIHAKPGPNDAQPLYFVSQAGRALLKGNEDRRVTELPHTTPA